MADFDESDTIVLYLEILTPALTSLIAGLVIHSFIIVVNVNDWLKGRSVTPVDRIITFLGISRMCAQCIVTARLLVYIPFQINPYSNIILIIIRALYSLFLYANVWLTSLLSIVFCLKISSLHTRLFLYLRRMIEQRTACCIAATLFASTLNYLLPLLSVIDEMIEGKTYNITKDDISRECNYIHFFYSFTTGSFIALLFFSISSILLFSSLYHHTRKMKMSGNLSINLETYYSTMKFVSVTFIYTTIYFTCYFVSVSFYYLRCMSIARLYIILGGLPVLHSCYLIYRTAKLRSQMSKVLQNVMDFLFQRKDPETREEIEMGD